MRRFEMIHRDKNTGEMKCHELKRPTKREQDRSLRNSTRHNEVKAERARVRADLRWGMVEA